MASIINTARGTANINTDRHVVDMSNKIALLRPAQTPLTALLRRISKKGTHNYRFDWLEDDLMGRWTEADGAVEASNDIHPTKIDVATGGGSLIAVNDLLKIVDTGEIVKVTAIDADEVTVIRGYGETLAAKIPDEAKILVVGNAMMQGSGASAEKYNITTTQFNYTQIFKTPFSVTSTLEAMKLYGSNSELARLQRKKAEEHNMSIEYALLFGERKLDTSGAQPITTTGGVLKYLSGTDNVSSKTKAAVTKADLDNWIEQVMTYGSQSKLWLCSPSIITWVNSLADAKLQLIQSDMDKTFGLNITKYMTPHGTLNMVHHPLLVQGYAGYSILLDMEEVAYRPLTGRDTKLKTNIQLPDEDGRRDMYITEAGLELKLAQKHGMFIIQ